MMLAEWTGLEPATPGVTGRYSNQLNYHSNVPDTCRITPQCRPTGRSTWLHFAGMASRTWRPLGDSNPCNHRERVVS